MGRGVEAAAAPRRSLVRRTVGALGTIVGISLVTFAFGELSSRLVLGIRPLSEARGIYAADARLGWRHAPGGEGDFVKLGTRQHIRINALGLRDVERDPAKPRGRKRVLVLGDSAVAGLEVPLDKTWTQLTEKKLRAKGYDVEVWNAGVRGWGTDQALVYLQDEGMRYAPDLVLYFWNDNDVDDNQTIHRPFREFGKSWFALDGDGALVLRGVPVPQYPKADNVRVGEDGNPVHLPVSDAVRVQMWLRDEVVMRTAFGSALAHVVAAVPQLTATITRWGTYGDFRDGGRVFDRTTPVFRVTTAMVAAMRSTAASGGAEFRMLFADGAWPRAVREELALPGLGDQAGFLAGMPKGGRFLVPFDSHWNELGHEVYAQALAETLAGSGLLGPAPAR